VVTRGGLSSANKQFVVTRGGLSSSNKQFVVTRGGHSYWVDKKLRQNEMKQEVYTIICIYYNF
jgi:hypothetical protein